LQTRDSILVVRIIKRSARDAVPPHQVTSAVMQRYGILLYLSERLLARCIKPLGVTTNAKKDDDENI